jgi:hypothetical protein
MIRCAPHPSRLPGEGRDPFLLWAPAFAGVAGFFDVFTCPRHLMISLLGLNTIIAGSPGVIMPPASAEVTALIAAAMSAALSIGGNTNLAVRSRQGGRMRSI